MPIISNFPGATGVSDADLARVEATAERALKAVQRVAYVIDTVPYQTVAPTYNGEVQAPVWGAFDPEKLEIGGVSEAVDAGEYEATFTPKGYYVWVDETADPVTVKWTIQRAVITDIPAQSGGLVYTGAEQSPDWSGYESGKLELGGDMTGVDVGSYMATFTPTANYKWENGSIAEKAVEWTIERAVVAVPSQSGSLTYTGTAQSPNWEGYDTAKLTIGGTTSGINAGTYAATFTPTENYRWEDGTTVAKAVNWAIGKAAGSLSLNKTSMALDMFGTISGTIAVTRAGDGAISAVSSNTAVATVSVSGNTVTVTRVGGGSAVITVSVGEGTNYTAPANKTCSVTVTQPSYTLNDNTWAVIRQVSDANQGANYWAVGDTKADTGLYYNENLKAFIIGFNHNSVQEGGSRIHFQVGKIEGHTDLFGMSSSGKGYEKTGAGYCHMNNSATNSGGWAGSYMRNTWLGNSGTPTNPLTGSIMEKMSYALRAVMKPVTKYSDNVGGGSDSAGYVTATTDYLFLLSEFEFSGRRNKANSAEKNYQAQYDYYKAGNSPLHHLSDKPAATGVGLTRSVNADADDSFCKVSSVGGATSYGAIIATYVCYIAPCFCV